MALYASFAGSRIVSARVTLPPWGAWSADVQLAAEDAVSPRGVLTIGNLSLVGAVLPGRDGPFAGSRSLRLVGGAGGWYRTVGARFYAKPQGVRLATVLGDVAAEVGEAIVLSSAFTSRVVGQFWARAAGQAVGVLSVAAGRAWYIDEVGVTQVGERPSTTVSSPFTISGPGYRGSLGMVEIATEDLLSWRPGALFRSELLSTPLTVASVSIHMAADSTLRLEVMTS
jgi:hypothetical protein